MNLLDFKEETDTIVAMILSDDCPKDLPVLAERNMYFLALLEASKEGADIEKIIEDAVGVMGRIAKAREEKGRG